jgi:hypothetical protein
MVEFEVARRHDAGGKTWVGRLKNLHARSYLSVKLAQRQYRSLALWYLQIIFPR